MKKEKPNKTNSTVYQVILDSVKILSREDGYEADASFLASLADRLKSNTSLLEKIDNEFSGHQYPTSSITFTKLERNFPLEDFDISTLAADILYFFCKTMNVYNSIQVSRDKLKEIFHTGNTQVKKAVQELLDNGLIAVNIKSTTHFSAVYIVNPEIATCGRTTEQRKEFIYFTFWTRTGSKSGYDKEGRLQWVSKSRAQSVFEEKMLELKAHPKYRIGYSSAVMSDGSILYFNRLNPPKLVKGGGNSRTRATAEEVPDDMMAFFHPMQEEEDANLPPQEELPTNNAETFHISGSWSDVDSDDAVNGFTNPPPDDVSIPF